MFTPRLATKLYLPQPRPQAVNRPRLIEQLNAGMHCKLSLISAPAGFGKTTLLSAWVAGSEWRAAWLSLDEGDRDVARFLAYLAAALQTIAPQMGAGMLALLDSPQPPPAEALLTALLNEIATFPHEFVLLLDDYHVVDAPAADHALTFLLDHLPPQMHLVIATREDPQIPLARLRARGQLAELRAADLRFTPDEAAAFLNQAMGLHLSAEEVALLEARTEGWIAGLQLAAISMQGQHAAGQQDYASFIAAFTGSHRFVLDYLVEEVLHQQPASIQTFLLRTSILDRLCGPLCDAVVCEPVTPGQETLELLERANLFLVPLDNERRWYRYHHLFAELLRQRLGQSRALANGDQKRSIAEYHQRASQWYEENDLELDAFHHATAAGDVARAAHLIEGKGMPLHFRGAVRPVLNWLASLPKPVLDANPTLWVMYASALSMSGQLTNVEEKLQGAEAALQNLEPDAKTRNLIGHVAAIRAFLASVQHQVETIIAQSQRALEYLHPENLSVRTATIWKLGIAHHLQGERGAARRAYTEAIAASQTSGNMIVNISARVGLGQIQETETELYVAAETYRDVLNLVDNSSQAIAGEAHLGLARIHYQWNELEVAQQHGAQSLILAEQTENVDNPALCRVFLARLRLAQGDVDGASALLAQAEQFVRQQHFTHRMSDVAAVQVLVLLRQGKLAAALDLAQTHDLLLGQARVHLAQGDPSAALAVLERARREATTKAWTDRLLQALVLQAVARTGQGEIEQALHLLGDALALAAPGGYIRLFVDEGVEVAHLMSAAAARDLAPGYTDKLLAAWKVEGKARSEQAQLALSPPSPPPPSPPPPSPAPPSPAPTAPLVEPLSQRELEILHLIAVGRKNQEIADALIISLNTVRYHTKNLYGKLGVHKRTQAVARARELGVM
jgi:LuxR family maltose regulon positive regulatory protein